jgi:diacylglycerol kinase (ATP)
MDHFCLFFNPVAGQGRAARTGPHLQSILAELGTVDWCPTTQPGDARRLAAEVAGAATSTVVAVGGDGTINEIINGLMAAQGELPRPRLAILPVGSANDIAKALGITGIDETLSCLAAGTERAIDLGLVTGSTGWSHYFCMSAGIGIVAAIAAERNRIRHLRGPALYFLAALRTILKGPAPLHLSISFDGGQQEEISVGALLANNSPRSGGFTLAPAADMSDGVLDVLALREHGRKLTTFRLVQLLLAVRAGTHLQYEEIVERRCRELSLATTHALTLQLDGELHHLSAGAASPLHIRLLPGALTVASRS